MVRPGRFQAQAVAQRSNRPAVALLGYDDRVEKRRELELAAAAAQEAAKVRCLAESVALKVTGG